MPTDPAFLTCVKLRAPRALYIERMTTVPATHHLDTSSEPLTSFSQCHLGILSQLLAFEELPAVEKRVVELVKEGKNDEAKKYVTCKYKMY